MKHIKGTTLLSQACHLCGRLPKRFLDEDIWDCDDAPDSSILSLCMAVMHAWIRSMEFLFNLACRIKVGHPTTLKSPEFKLKKSVLQTEFKARVGIEVYKVKQGCGSSNDGNKARRFFRHPETPHLLGIKPEILDCLRDLVQMWNNPKVFPYHIEYQSKVPRFPSSQ